MTETETKHEEKPKTTTLTRKLLFIVVPLFVIILGWFIFIVKDKVFPLPKVHYHAGFIVIKDNQLVSFTDEKYMKISPCTTDTKHDEEETPQSAQIEKAHLHDNIGDVIHIEKAGSKWSDLFININYPINYQSSTAYLNDKKVNDFQNQVIQPYDSIVIFEGNSNDESKFLTQKVKKDHIAEIAKKSESCGS